MSDKIAIAIGNEYRKAKGSMIDNVKHLLEVGRMLIEKKESLDHGQWIPWLDENRDVLGFTVNVANGIVKETKANCGLTHNLTEVEAARINRKMWRNKKVKNASKKKSKATPKRDKVQAVVEELVRTGQPVSRKKLANEYDVGQQTIQLAEVEARGRLEAEAQIDPETLSQTAQEKLAAAMRQHQRKLDQEFELRVQTEIQKRLDEMILPRYNETKARYEKVVGSRKGIMDKKTYKLILSSLHPDSRKSVSDERLNEAFRQFSELEILFIDEKQNPTLTAPMPNTLQEMMANRK